MLENYEKLGDIGKGKYPAHVCAIFHCGHIQIFAFSFIGSFGTVSKIRRISDGRILVWKELDYGKMNDKEKQ
jgi:hypothetical protein